MVASLGLRKVGIYSSLVFCNCSEFSGKLVVNLTEAEDIGEDTAE
jgi:hypothetical protein